MRYAKPANADSSARRECDGRQTLDVRQTEASQEAQQSVDAHGQGEDQEHDRAPVHARGWSHDAEEPRNQRTRASSRWEDARADVWHSVPLRRDVSRMFTDARRGPRQMLLIFAVGIVARAWTRYSSCRAGTTFDRRRGRGRWFPREGRRRCRRTDGDVERHRVDGRARGSSRGSRERRDWCRARVVYAHGRGDRRRGSPTRLFAAVRGAVGQDGTASRRPPWWRSSDSGARRRSAEVFPSRATFSGMPNVRWNVRHLHHARRGRPRARPGCD